MLDARLLCVATICMPKKAGARTSWSMNGAIPQSAACRLAKDDVARRNGAGLGTLTSRLLATRGHRDCCRTRARDMCSVLRNELGAEPRFVLRRRKCAACRLRCARGASTVVDFCWSKSALSDRVPADFRFLAIRSSLRRIVIMIQREMADRVLAPPGSQDSNALGVRVQMGVVPCVRFYQVGRRAFLPPPRGRSVGDFARTTAGNCSAGARPRYVSPCGARCVWPATPDLQIPCRRCFLTM